jgi:hypothetical protein
LSGLRGTDLQQWGHDSDQHHSYVIETIVLIILKRPLSLKPCETFISVGSPKSMRQETFVYGNAPCKVEAWRWEQRQSRPVI